MPKTWLISFLALNTTFLLHSVPLRQDYIGMAAATTCDKTLRPKPNQHGLRVYDTYIDSEDIVPADDTNF